MSKLAVEQSQAILDTITARPSLLYFPGRSRDLDGKPIEPADNGQLQFHKAPHVIRAVAPGNGWGKTACAAVEADWWGFGDHPWQKVPRDRPRMLMWVAQKYQQYAMQRPMIEKWWPKSVRDSWNEKYYRYSWPPVKPGGPATLLYVITAETDWETIQGVEPDLVILDEECDWQLWHELQRRRRGKIETRYVITATATKGLTWTYQHVYLPWLQYHQKLGMGESEAMRRQLHRYDEAELANVPGIWCWPRGSHRDNHTATPQSWAMYLAIPTRSKAEREVRLWGGYRDFTGSPVFELDNLESLRPKLERGRSGVVEEYQEEKPK